jgi:hypothetical protein
VVATRGAGGLTGVGLAAAFAVGVAFLGDARRTSVFSAGFFLTAMVFLRAVALPTTVFLRFGFALRLFFFFVAITPLP